MLVPHNIVMDLNNVMLPFKVCQSFFSMELTYQKCSFYLVNWPHKNVLVSPNNYDLSIFGFMHEFWTIPTTNTMYIR